MNTNLVDLNQFRSVMAEGHSADTSNKFSFIPTTRVVDILATQEWYPSKALERRARKPEKIGYQNHLIRFRRAEDLSQLAVVGEYVPEIVLKNAHDGTSSFQIMVGLYRFVCKNGAVVADSTFETYRIKHLGFQDQNVIDAVFKVVETTPKILEKVDEFKQIALSVPEQIAMGESALIAKYGEENMKFQDEINRFDYRKLIAPLRQQDRLGENGENTLWNVFNILQEKLVEKGGMFAMKEVDDYLKPVKARGIKSVSENIRVNQAVWALTEKMAELKH